MACCTDRTVQCFACACPWALGSSDPHEQQVRSVSSRCFPQSVFGKTPDETQKFGARITRNPKYLISTSRELC